MYVFKERSSLGIIDMTSISYLATVAILANCSELLTSLNFQI